jgi:hypothetical protein
VQRVVRRKAIVDSLKKFMSNVGDDIRVVRFGCMVVDCNQACSPSVVLLDMGEWRNQMIAYPMICWIVCCLWLAVLIVILMVGGYFRGLRIMVCFRVSCKACMMRIVG